MDDRMMGKVPLRPFSVSTTDFESPRVGEQTPAPRPGGGPVSEQQTLDTSLRPEPPFLSFSVAVS